MRKFVVALLLFMVGASFAATTYPTVTSPSSPGAGSCPSSYKGVVMTANPLGFYACLDLDSNGSDFWDELTPVYSLPIYSGADCTVFGTPDAGTTCWSPRAIELGWQIDKDPRLVELILFESREVLRTRPGTIIVEHRLGFVSANEGIDHSNVAGAGNAAEEWVLLLPQDPDRSAEKIREAIRSKTGKNIGVLIIDSHGRAWRNGTVGVAIGLSGMPGLEDLRGRQDLFDFTLRITQVGAADELAAAASLIMGQAAEGTPVVHVRGFPYPLREGSLQELLRPKDQDLFR